jgi:hypothetical protein
MPAVSRAAVVLLVLLAGAPALALSPGRVGAIRVGGVALLWWYVCVLLPAGAWAALWLGVDRGGAEGALAPRGPGADALLAWWLAPAAGASAAVLVASRGLDGLWAGAMLALGPILALALGADTSPREEPGREPLLALSVGMLACLVLIWACLALGGDLAVRLGAPRWHGVAVPAAGALILTAVGSPPRGWAALAGTAGLAAALALLGVVASAAVGPLRAWEEVSGRSAFRFGEAHPWTTVGRDLSGLRGSEPLAFDEAHRLTAATPGLVRALTADGAAPSERQWQLAAGQSVTLLAGDRLLPTSGTRLRFEAGRRIPGAPASGEAWASGPPGAWPTRIALAVTLLGGAIGLLGGRRSALGRGAVWRAGLLVLACWGAAALGVYATRAAPELALGGGVADALIDLGGAGASGRLTWPASALLVAALAGFLAAVGGLQRRVGAMDPTDRGEIGRDLGLWSAVLAVAAAAALWPVDSWALSVWALGAAAAALAPGVLLPRAATARLAGGLAGLACFLALSALGQARLSGSVAASGAWGAWSGAALAHPAVIALPVGGAVLWLAARLGRG